MLKTQDYPDKELLLRVKSIMVIRVVFLTGFVALAIAFEHNARYETPIIPLSIVLGSAYFLCIIYALMLKMKMPLNWVAYAQVLGDLATVGGLIYTTGGIESPLSFVFLFVIIATSVMLPRAAVYLAASGASIIYGLLVDLEYFNFIQPIYFFQKSNISYQGAYGFYIIALNLTSFYSVAYLSSILNHRLRIINDELHSKSLDLKKLQEFHKNVVQNMVNGLLTTDHNGHVTSVNTACEQITGCSADHSLGRLAYDLLPVPTLKTFFLGRQSVQLPATLEGEFQRNDGETILVVMKISSLIRPSMDPFKDGYKSEGYIVVLDDLTELRKMEEKILQSEQLAAVGRFSAGLAHEIRNPLASLSGSIQVLRDSLQVEDQYKRLMDIVISETERLNAIIKDFLSYSQPRKSKATVIDLTQLLQDVVLLIKNNNEYDCSIEIELDMPARHIVIQSEEDQVKQMVWNLCLNGMQAMDRAGTIRLELKEVQGHRHRDFETDRKGVLLSVEDQGRGIPPDKLKQIFDPFFTTREEGIGLGLATVNKIIQRFGGQIGVVSEVGKGTRFDIFLPQERAIVGTREPKQEKRSQTLSPN
ncbi:ATP-binding protein [Nitrospina watsonii]|uniref:histidine kinase n=1 Tax=Nitrospina watsonii TaxID=1323948 RepID=A0ABM9H9S7_9BACT|nr:ATP-binding protein [Nitrospina watsonii]CAI2716889.1 Two-component sensor PilS [Nitrospina watsonii]